LLINERAAFSDHNSPFAMRSLHNDLFVKSWIVDFEIGGNGGRRIICCIYGRDLFLVDR
jgi:hypothetical protein